MDSEGNAVKVSKTTIGRRETALALFTLTTGIIALLNGLVELRKFLASGNESEALFTAFQFAGAALLLQFSHGYMVESVKTE